MVVEELIALLQQQPPEAIVYTHSPEEEGLVEVTGLALESVQSGFDIRHYVNIRTDEVERDDQPDAEAN